MPATHDQLWTCLRAALAKCKALPSGNVTPADIALHVEGRLPTDAVHRFVHDYLYKKQFGTADEEMISAAETTSSSRQPLVCPTSIYSMKRKGVGS